MSRSVRVVGADAVGKLSFVLALGAKKTVGVPPRHLSSTFLWPRLNGNGHKTTAVHILRKREDVLHGDDDDGVFVLLFDLTRRDSLAAVLAQWSYLSDAPGRRLLLVGTHADCTSKRQVSLAEVRDISGDYHAYEEVCCRPRHSGDEGMLRVQLLLRRWTSESPRVMATDIPLGRASICGGFPRPVVTMAMPSNSSHSLPASPAGQRRPCMRADVWLYDPTEEVSSASSVGGDVKLRTISKAIYDIRGAVAAKSKVLAKYRDRKMSHWLTRSRYFGPTESSRHKRWQEEQKKRQQLTQTRVHHQHHTDHMRRQSSMPDHLLEQRARSVSQPNKTNLPSRKASVRRGPAHYSSSSSSENDESSGTPLERKSFMQPTESATQRQRQVEAAFSEEQKKRLAAKRALRKQRRATSNDFYERSTSPAVFASYLDCYDEMDMPLQLRPYSPSLSRRNPPSGPSPVSSAASSTSRKSLASKSNSFETDGLISGKMQHAYELLSPGSDPVRCLPASLPSTPLQSPAPPIVGPPTPSSPSLSIRRHHSINGDASGNLDYDSLSESVLKLAISDMPLANSKSSLPRNAFPKTIVLPATSHQDNFAASRTNTICSSSSENFDCSDIDDVLEYFEGVTLPI